MLVEKVCSELSQIFTLLCIFLSYHHQHSTNVFVQHCWLGMDDIALVYETILNTNEGQNWDGR